MKKAKMLLCAVLILTIFSGTIRAVGWADAAMGNLAARQIMDSIPENPDEFITRESFSIMLARAALYRADTTLVPGDFRDASVFYDAGSIREEGIPYIMYLYELGILTGSLIHGRLHMLPGSLLSRQDAVTLLGRWLGLCGDEGRTDHANAFADDSAIADYAHSIVYRLSGFGIISGYPDGSFRPLNNISYAEMATLVYNILEGRPVATYSGDGHLGREDGVASAARFALPSGLSLDNNGNLVVFDTFNASVRRIDRQTRSAETLLGFSEAIDDYGFIMAAYADGTRANALFGRPADGVFAPGGDLFIVDSVNHAIRLFRNNMVYTFAGGEQGFGDGSRTSAKFDNPTAIDIDSDGNLYIADTMNHVIRKIAPNGTVSTIAGRAGTPGYADGDALQALFTEPSGIAVGENGVIYVADTGNHLIRRIENGSVSTVAGVAGQIQTGEYYRPGGYEDGLAPFARFNFPRGLFHADGILFIADSGNHAVRALVGGSVITVMGNGMPGYTDGILGEATMNRPSAVVLRNGVLYIADTLNNTIRAVTLDLSSLGR